MTSDKIVSLEKQIADLRAEVADVRGALMLESKNNTKYINAIYRYIADINDLLMPAIDKLFPGNKAATRQLEEFLARYHALGNAKRPR